MAEDEQVVMLQQPRNLLLLRRRQIRQIRPLDHSSERLLGPHRLAVMPPLKQRAGDGAGCDTPLAAWSRPRPVQRPCRVVVREGRPGGDPVVLRRAPEDDHGDVDEDLCR